MTANTNLKNDAAKATTNLRPEPISLQVRTGVKAGKVTFQDFHFTKKVDKPSPTL